MKRTLLVTGASSDISASLVRRLAGSFDEVIDAARRVDRMRAECADLPSVTPARLDVSGPANTEMYLGPSPRPPATPPSRVRSTSTRKATPFGANPAEAAVPNA